MELVDFTEKQARSIELSHEHRISIYDGSIRSGKTINSLFAWLAFLIEEMPTGLLLISGFSKETIKANILEPLLELLGPTQIKWNDNECTIWVECADGITRAFKHAIVGGKTVLAEGRIRGRTLSGALVDEVTLLDPGFWAQLKGRLSASGARLIGTTNPGSPNHWLLTDDLVRARTLIDRHGIEHNLAVRCEEEVVRGTLVRTWFDEDNKVLLDLARFQYTIDDNIALDPVFVANAKLEHQGVFYRRNILGEWCIAEGAVYAMFDPAVGGEHVIRDIELPRYDNGTVTLHNWCMGIDHGTINPFHAIVYGFDKWGRMYAVREWRYSSKENHNRQMTDAEYSKALSDWVQAGADGIFLPGAMTLRAMTLFVDPAATSFRTQLARDGHGYGADVDKAVTAGINDVGSCLQAGILLTSEKCKHLIRERASYSWDPKAQEAGRDEPMKIDDHGVDAERYVVRKTRRWWGNALILASTGRLPAFRPTSRPEAMLAA